MVSNSEFPMVNNFDIMCLLARRIKDYRLAARISQAEMAERSGVGLATIAHLEQEKQVNITLNNLISIFKVLGQEDRIINLLPELPISPLALKKINKLIPKRIRKKDDR